MTNAQMFRYELTLMSCDAFGAVSTTQRPDRTVKLPRGSKVVGVTTKHGDAFLVVQRRVWFWQRKAAPARALDRTSVAFGRLAG